MSDTSKANEFSAMPTVTDLEVEESRKDRSTSFPRRMRRCLWHIVFRQITLLSEIALVIAGWIGRRPRVGGKGCDIMLTGRFDSNNWILAFLGPLAASNECSRLYMVSTNLVPTIPKVEAIYPPKWLMKAVGATGARLLTFAWLAVVKRPYVVGGFYLLPNGIAAAIMGRLICAKSLYFCTGGPVEVQDGGVHSADNATVKMESADAVVEKRLLNTVSRFDAIITMGTKAVRYFQNEGVNTNFHVVSGAIDTKRFHPTKNTPSKDLVLTGRLVPIKRIDIFLLAVKQVVEKLPELRAVIVGDGEMRQTLQQFSIELGIDRNVNFTGYLDDSDVVVQLCDSKIFVLTSDSEGLSLSMTEAMMCGLPVIVSNVGDLGDLVEDGVNGFLVPRRSPGLFAKHIVELLKDERKWQEFSKAARRTALRYETNETIKRWDDILGNNHK